MALEIKDNFSKVLEKSIYGTNTSYPIGYYAQSTDKLFMEDDNGYCYKGIRDGAITIDDSYLLSYINGTRWPNGNDNEYGKSSYVNLWLGSYDETYTKSCVCFYCGDSNEIGESTDTGLRGKKVSISTNISIAHSYGTISYNCTITNNNTSSVSIGEVGLVAHIIPSKSDGTLMSSVTNGQYYTCKVLLARERFDKLLVLNPGESRVVSMALRIR